MIYLFTFYYKHRVDIKNVLIYDVSTMISIWNLQRMRTARRARNLSTKHASSQLKITPEYLSMLENGHRQPSQHVIARMSALYDQPTAYFLLDAGEFSAT